MKDTFQNSIKKCIWVSNGYLQKAKKRQQCRLLLATAFGTAKLSAASFLTVALFARTSLRNRLTVPAELSGRENGDDLFLFVIRPVSRSETIEIAPKIAF